METQNKAIMNLTATLVFLLNLLYISAYNTEMDGFDVTESVRNNSKLLIIQRGDKMVYVPEDLQRKMQEEDMWHLTPWLRTRVEVLGNELREACATSDSVNSFPDGIFDDDQLRQGAFILYLIFGVFAFTLLAIVCNDYFIPCVELICEDLKIPENVAAATFMSVATSCPEFFVNLISTFLTESDMGIGTIVGSAIFNALGVAAIGSLAAIRPISIEKKPVTRDAMIYIFNVFILVGIVWDGQVDWYEGLVLGGLYILYFVLMFNSVKLFNAYDKMILMCCKKNVAEITTPVKVEDNLQSEPIEGIDNKAFKNDESNLNPIFVIDAEKVEKAVDNDDDSIKAQKLSIWSFPSHASVAYKIFWLVTWPIRFVLAMTIPSPILYRRFYPLAFIMCIIWIGVNSYFVSWSMTVIGHTFLIPDSVMGMTFLAFGGCLPEACSIFIMSRQGKGGIGVSNALGANSLAILFALGMPWLIKTLTLLASGSDTPVVYINSTGIDVVVGSLVLAVCSLWLTLFIGNFQLRRSLGFVFVVLYVLFITFAVLTEMGIIFDRATATC